jgi:type II secretory pathway component PulJ
MTEPSLAEDDGFSVLELILCLGLLALMTALTTEAVSLAQRGTGVIDRIERADADRAVQAFLRRTIEGAAPLLSTRGDGTAAILFDGYPDRLRLVSRANGELEGGGLVLVELRMEDSVAGRALVTDRKLLNAASELPGPGTYRLRDDVKAVGFRYYGRRTMQEQSGWTSEWAGVSDLPQLVEVTLSPAEDEAPAWPPLVVAIPAALGATN